MDMLRSNGNSLGSPRIGPTVGRICRKGRFKLEVNK